jgi:hypothetical protein
VTSVDKEIFTMPETRFVVTVKVTIDDRGANVNEILQAVGQAREAFGVQLTEHIIEWQQQQIRDRLCGTDRSAKKGLGWHDDKTNPPHRCACRNFVKEGFRDKKRCLRSDLGVIQFSVARVSCQRCGKKFAPILDVLGLQRRAGHAGQLERVVVEAACKTSFARSVANVEGLAGIPVSKSTGHRWVADLDVPEVRPPPLQMLLADGTAYKKAGGKRGELRVAIGLTEKGRVVPLGSWSGQSWKQITKGLRRRLGYLPKPAVAVTDGEQGLEKYFATLAGRGQRSCWHFLRDLRVILWRDGLKKKQTDPLTKKLAGIVGMEIPEGDWEAVLPLTKEPLRREVDKARASFQAMIDEFDAMGYRKGKLYLEGARDRIFSRIELWLKTGIIAPRSTGILEEIMREVGRRVKKLGWNWKDHGASQQASVILLRRYSEDQWNTYWRKRLNLRGRCQIDITAFEQSN